MRGDIRFPEITSAAALAAAICAAVVVARGQAQPVTDGLTLALRADALQAYAHNDPVSTWPDQSGGGLDVDQPDAGRRPRYQTGVLNGKPTLLFDGDDYLYRSSVIGSSLTNTTEAHVFAVMRQAGDDPVNSIIGWGPSHNRLLVHATWNDILCLQHGDPAGSQCWSQPPTWDDQWNIVDVWRSGSVGELRLSGAGHGRRPYTDTPEVGDVDTLYIANDRFSNILTGQVAEILVYRRALTASERDAVSAYLSAKYGLPLEPIVPGDVDCDGDVDFFDIDPFVTALSGPVAYYTAYPNCNWLNADTSCNGAVDFFDIDAFVACLGGACECP
jgi:hypothetical protein